MPNRVPWEPAYSVGHELIDAQHHGLLSQCELLAELCAEDANADADRLFDEAFERLKTLVREHFAAEALLLADCDGPEREDHRAECEEFEYLAGEIATTENFDRLELQRFIALWLAGHVAGSAQWLRDSLASRGAQG